MEEKILRRQPIHTGRIFSLERLDIELPDGQLNHRDVIRHPGATALVAVDDEGKILLVRQYRAAAERVLREIPAGTLNPAEPPLDCAIRELQEETGYRPGKIEPLGGFFVAPGYTSEYIHLFLASDLIASELPKDEDEFIEVDHVSLEAALAMIEAGEIVDGKTIIGLLRYARQVGR